MQINNTVSILSDLKSKQDIFIFRTIYVVVVDVDGSVVRRCCSKQKLEKSKTSDRKNCKKKRKKGNGIGKYKRGRSVNNRRNRDGIASSFLHPHPLAPFLHRRPRPEMDPFPHSPRQYVPLSLSLYTFFFPKFKASNAFLCYMHFINCMLVRDLVWTWQVEALQWNLQSSPFFSLL